MNSFALVLVIPTLLTIASAGTLYFSFKGKVDASGRYFLLAEFLWLWTLSITITININSSVATSGVFFFYTALTLLSEVAILLSIKSLTHKIAIRQFIFWIIFVIVCCGVNEYSRNYINPRLPLLFVSFFSLCVTSLTYIACKKINSDELRSNLFFKWIVFTELSLTIIHVLRFTSFFSNAPMMAINPPTIPIVIFSIWAAFNLFRYFSYLALRISWIDPRVTSENPLNKNLIKLVREKDQFLQGLISSNRALGISALANSLAHQLSQPITGIILQTETVKRDLTDQGGHEKSVKTLNSVTEHLGKISTLVNNLRKLFGNREFEFRNFSIVEACDEVLEIIKPTLQSKNILLVKSYEGNPIAYGNAIQIQQVLINLFNNAIDSIENSEKDHREINIRVSSDTTYALIAIKDTGDGIADNISSTMFELYQSTKPNGLGIGLWLCKAILDKHGGLISASNDQLTGATFEIRIPLAKAFHEGS